MRTAARRFWHRFACAYWLVVSVAAAQVALAPVSVDITVAPGLTYLYIQRESPTGEPWSIHVLELQRDRHDLQLRAVATTGVWGEMHRELPTAMAGHAAAPGERVFAVVNGDYDLQKEYPGVSDGLAVTSGRLWTSAHRGRPVFAASKRGKPLIGIPSVTIEIRARGRRWEVASLNKPAGTPFEGWPRLYTREFRPTLKSDIPVRAVVVGKVSPPLPLRADGKLRGQVLRVIESAAEFPVEQDAIVITEAVAQPIGLAGLRPGDRVGIRVRTRVAGRKVRHAVGGFPVLVRDGRKSIEGNPGDALSSRHPRTALCYNRQKILFTVVDGRQPALSVGMTLDELADLMVSLGCEVAMNTDGGGSSVMAISAPQNKAGLRIVNSPSDGKERGRGNAWVVVGGR